MREIFIDFETRSACDLKVAGVHVYAEDESTGVWCAAYAIDDGPVYLWKEGEAFPKGILNAMSGEYIIVAHNVAFEAAIWENVLTPRYGWPKFDYTRARCTMAECYAMSLPGSLEKAALALNLDIEKDMRGSRIAVQLSKPRDIEDGKIVWWDDPEKFETLYSYCRTDVEVQRQIFRRVKRLSPSERKVWEFDFRLNKRGVKVDLEALKEAHKIVEFEKSRLDARMREITNNAVATCNAVMQITDYLREKGVDTSGIGKAQLTDLLRRDDLSPHLREVLELRQEAAKASTAKIIAMINRAGKDGRMRGLFQYHGANTGRWASRGPQVQNLKRSEFDDDVVEQIFETLKS